MAKLTWLVSLSILVIFLISENEATAPLFLQAITSALATIPFTGGPMTTGLVGAKLAIGTKLLYYLGFFGRRSKPVPAPVAKATTSAAGFAGGLQAVPLPYYLSGAGRFPQMGNDFGAQGGFYQQSFGGIDPAQMFQALKAQGFDANTAMQMMNYGGLEFGGGFANMPQGGGFANMPQGGGFANMPQGGGFANMPQGGGFANMPQGGGFANMPQGGGFAKIPQEFPQEEPVEENVVSQNPSEGASDDIESFFTFLKDMDENLCISRLVCDIGNDPSFLGDFSENIHSIVKSLEVAPTSGAYPYIEIMETGREGGCGGRFPQCSDSAYEIVKNVAPSVGVPSNINAEAVDQL